MDNTTYIQTLFEQAPDQVQDYILSGELENVIVIVGKIHKLPIATYITLKNIVLFVLLDAIQTNKIVSTVETECNVTEVEAKAIVKDLDQSVFQKVRVSVLGVNDTGVKTIKLTDATDAKKEALRKQLMDTTKRIHETTEVAQPTTPQKSEAQPLTNNPLKSNLQPGSRAQLLEQLHVLQTIPNDEEVEARLNNIKSQVSKLDEKKEEAPINTATTLSLTENGTMLVDPVEKSATYSKAPTQYNVDPYREQVA